MTQGDGNFSGGDQSVVDPPSPNRQSPAVKPPTSASDPNTSDADTSSNTEDSWPEQGFIPPQDEQPKSMKATLKSGFKKVLKVVAVVVLTIVGLGMGSCSFSEIEKMRQLERTPEVDNAAVITGEVNITGRAEAMSDDRLLTAPDSGAQTLYYHYHVERREEDSDGNTRWRTQHRSTEAVDFLLRDDTGALIIAATDRGIDFDVDRSHRRRSGDMRYTEYRIDPGQSVFIFGYAEQTERGFQVGFQQEGNYYPLISTGDEEGQRFSRAMSSALMVVGGVAALLFAIYFLMRIFRVHHSALYLGVATSVVVIVLGAQGSLMMIGDLRGADERADRMLQEGTDVIDDILTEHGVEWDGELDTLGEIDEADLADLPATHRERVTGVRMMMARSIERTNNNLSRFPEMFVGPLVGVRSVDPLEVPESEQRRIQELEADFEPIRTGRNLGLIALFIGLLGTFFGTRRGMGRIILKRTIENIPTSPISGAVYGLTELKGKAKLCGGDDCLTGPLTKNECVYYRYKVEKRVRRRRNGKTRYRWKTIRDESKSAPFLCRDRTGQMLVDPEGAECSARRRVRRRRGKRRYTEWSIRPGDDVYTLGTAVINPETHDDLILANDDDDTPFLVSSLTEAELMQKKAAQGFMLLNFGIVATMVAGMGIAGMAVNFGPALYVTTATIACSYLFVVLVLLYYNDLVFLRDRVDRNWSNIDVALKKRFDLINNLAEVVQQFLGHERQLQKRVAEARNARQGADHESPDESELRAEQRAVDQLIGLVEDHPRLRGQKVIHEMMDALREVEDDIALMRKGYNDSVERYNNRIHHFPEVFVAKLLGFKDADHLRSTRSEAERRAPSELLGDSR